MRQGPPFSRYLAQRGKGCKGKSVPELGYSGALVNAVIIIIQIGEKPYKIVKARPKWDRYSQKMVTDLPLEVFGEWQVSRCSQSLLDFL